MCMLVHCGSTYLFVPDVIFYHWWGRPAEDAVNGSRRNLMQMIHHLTNDFFLSKKPQVSSQKDRPNKNGDCLKVKNIGISVKNYN